MPVLSHIFVLSPLLTPLGPGYRHSPRKYTVEHSDENLSLWPKTKGRHSGKWRVWESDPYLCMIAKGQAKWVWMINGVPKI